MINFVKKLKSNLIIFFNLLFSLLCYKNVFKRKLLTGKENDQLKCHEDNEHYVIDDRDSKYIKE